MEPRLKRTLQKSTFVPLLIVISAWLMVFAGVADAKKKVLILGVDGLDPKLLQEFMDAGLMPNFQQFVSEGDFKPLQTSMPPQSPVAWATFITGMDPGGHGLFDFVHRDPNTLAPYLSMSRAVPAERNLNIGSWVIPLSKGGVEQLRKGTAFWQILEDHGIPTTIVRIPANFPPVPSKGQSLSGMGTPDIQGTPGTFLYYTNNPPANAEDISGGRVFPVRVINHRVDAQLVGPKNTFRRFPRETQRGRTQEIQYENPDCTIDFSVFLDPVEPVARINVQGKEIILKEGEWSDWVRVDFDAVPWLVHISAIGRFYLQEVRPDFKLYVTPLQINPENPALPISTPKNWSKKLYDALGYFYTQELPEDTKALSGGIFTGNEFWTQSQFVYEEQRRALDYFLKHFKEGLLFFYLTSIDQNCHMMWRYVDEEHPGYSPEERLHNSIGIVYQKLDEALGEVRSRIDDDTVLIIMSDHGFAPYYWGVNLNSWLVEKGYVKLRDPARQEQYKYFMNVDWRRTKAYALGLNGLYINLKGREPNGIVEPGEEYEALLDQLEADLLAMRDPRNGRQAVTLVTRTHRDFNGPYIDIGPDIIVGYNWGYRSSWESPLGEFPRELFVDNKEAWSGDHCVDYRITPGVLVTNQRITMEEPALYDLTVAVLAEFGIDPLPEMIGQNCLAPSGRTAAGRKIPHDLKALGYMH